MTDDTTEDSLIESAAGEIDTAQKQTTTESFRASLHGWRRTAGTSLGFAVFLDLMFLLAALAVVNAFDSTVASVGAGLLAVVGVVGLLEKTYRRVN